jgi:xanthine dehydrogenase YagT iron-sulfur-binding subunit
VPVRWTRRELIETAAVIGSATFAAGRFGTSAEAATEASGQMEGTLNLTVNGSAHSLDIDPRATLLDTLRERIGLTGTKKGCDRGECGACTVHIDGRRVLSCMTLALLAEGHEVTTIEGLASGDELHPMQAAFIEHDAFQCGFCTPGQIMSAVALIAEGHAGSEADIKEYMSGNICRCSAYPQIRAAVAAAAGEG